MSATGSPHAATLTDSVAIRRYNAFLLLVAGLGGLLYGIDVGIIAGALPYLVATSGLNAGQISFVVAAVLLGTVISTLFAGVLADRMGRKYLMILSGALFAASIPVIALSHGYGPLFFGRLLQGIGGGLIGVVVPLYLAECLPARNRGQGTGVFQWLLTLGIVAAAVVGIYYSYRVGTVAAPQPLSVRVLHRSFAGSCFALGTIGRDGQSKFLPCVHRDRNTVGGVAKGNEKISESPSRPIGLHTPYSTARALGDGRLHRRF